MALAQPKPLRRVRSLLQRTIHSNEPIGIKHKHTKNTIIRDLFYDLRGVFDALIWIYELQYRSSLHVALN